MVPPYLQFFDDNGVPLAGGFVYTYTATGTFTIPKATYTTAAGNVEQTNPIVLDASGRPTLGNGSIWLSGTYDFKVTDSLGNIIETTQNVTAFTTLPSASDAYFETFSGNGSQVAFTTSSDLGVDEKAIYVWVNNGLAECTTNGNFASDSGWTKGAGWSIATGTAIATGAISTAISQTSARTIVAGQAYAVTYTITQSAGSLAPSVGDNPGVARSSSGTYSEVIIAGATQILAFTGSGFTGTLDNVSITVADSAGYEIQNPANYTINGTTLTFSSAPPIGTGNIYVSAPSLLVGAASSAAADAAASAADAAASQAAALASQTSATASASTASTAATNAAISAASAFAYASSTNVVAQGADPTGVVECSAIFQAAHDAIYNAAVAAGSNNPSGSVIVPPGIYKLSTGLTWVPWIKMISTGPVYLNFAGLSTSATAIRSSNETGPTTSPGKNSANTGPFINGSQGVIYIAGPGTGGTSIGLDLGNSSSLSAARAYRDVQIDGVVVSNFANPLNLRSYDTYLMTIRNSRFEIGGAACVAITNATNSNSGERMAFENCTFAGCTVGFSITTPGYDINFLNCSFDFNTNSAFQFNVGAGFQKITLTSCHLESSNNIALVKSNLASTNSLFVQLENCKIVPNNNVPTQTGSYTDGTSSPWTALFQGFMNLKIDGNLIGGYTHPAYGASTGLFMCDSSVRIIDSSHTTFTGFKQVISESQILNKNYNFNSGTSGTTLDYSTIAGWTYSTSLGISAALSNTQTFNNSTNSLAITETASPGSNFYTMDSDPFLVNQNDQITFQTVLYGGTSAGNINTTAIFIQYQVGVIAPVAISSITITGSTATVTTASAHGLSPAQFFVMSGATQAGYNGKRVIQTTPSPTTFTYTVDSTTVTPATGTPVYILESLIPINVSSSLGGFYSNIYAATGDPAYTGDRLWWAKQGVISSGFDNTKLLPGATHARCRITISALSAGDVVYLGTALMEKT